MYVEQKKSKMQLKWFASLLKALDRFAMRCLPLARVRIRVITLMIKRMLRIRKPKDILRTVLV